MVLVHSAEPVPIKADSDGVLRIGDTRVLLDTVVTAFNLGSTPEEIVFAYDTLRLEDVYLALGYYLRHRPELDPYLMERQRRGEENRAKAEAMSPWSEIRERLLARKQRQSDAAPRDG